MLDGIQRPEVKHDSQAEVRRIPVVFAQEERQNGEETQFGYIQYTETGATA